MSTDSFAGLSGDSSATAHADGRATLFLSDLHLSPALPRTTAAFYRLLDSLDAADVADVFILGDLFEFWIGDDMMRAPFEGDIVSRLATLSRRGIRLYVMHGNRDFLLGRAFARAAAATLIDDPFVIERFGQRWVLTHGDSLCTDDISYQRFRSVVRRRWLQKGFLYWPLQWRLRLAARIRANSARRGGARMIYTDVNAQALRAMYTQQHATRMIQGHTHRPARHEDGIDPESGAPHLRWVLSDWELDRPPRRANYLRLDAHGLTVVDIGIGANADTGTEIGAD